VTAEGPAAGARVMNRTDYLLAELRCGVVGREDATESAGAHLAAARDCR